MRYCNLPHKLDIQKFGLWEGGGSQVPVFIFCMWLQGSDVQLNAGLLNLLHAVQSLPKA